MEAFAVRNPRTTPRWLQLPGLLLLVLLAAYHGGGMRYGARMTADWPAWLRARPYTFAFGTWTMFTYRARRHSDVRAEAWRGDRWEPVDLEALFPARWDSGPRYVRRPLMRSVAHRRVFAQAICGRLPEPAEGVRISRVTWAKTLGQVAQPPVAETVEPLTTWPCAEPVSLPGGVRL